MILVNEPVLDGNEKKYLQQCIDTGWISSEGPFVEQFENMMADYVGRDFATSCSSGTAALDIAVAALGLKPGDEVIMPSFTIISCAQALVKLGIIPILVDSDYYTFNANAIDIESKITEKTKAIMVVHIYGLTVDFDPILGLSKKYGLQIIEDAAEVIGQSYKGKKCGSFGDVSIFSFYPNKHITTGEGGMVLSDKKQIDEAAKKLRNLCFGSERFIHDEIGYNYRMTNMQAALGVAQLEKIVSTLKKKRWIGSFYEYLLKDIEAINLPIASTDYCDNIYWVYAITIKENFFKDGRTIIKELGEQGIGARPFFYPMHKQPVFREMGLFDGICLPKSERLYERGFYIPSGLALSESQANQVSNVLHRLFS